VVCIFIKTIIGKFVLNEKQDQYETSESNGQSSDIYGSIKLLFTYASDGDNEIIPNHGTLVNRGREFYFSNEIWSEKGKDMEVIPPSGFPQSIFPDPSLEQLVQIPLDFW
jgi:hypothetical protein